MASLEENDIERQEAIVLATLLARLAGKDQYVYRRADCERYVVRNLPCKHKMAKTLIRVTINGEVLKWTKPDG